ncbi:hypothetical protein cce_0101 [Crocosphaera subtropica ATCC 51142]|uniref:Uncharacterized protein n=1 Tax=Crocosphaera subtropica (strain ATCC 51142 / BH68) TaxID=43989 RepID=B1WZ87_CROS5|nr:hypothetical protein [Crocosphaera subtropica]ACB49453.1 hypothetical protein cce_0101 [Crocosphaera subtropica ATCC 51142]
MIQLPDLSIVKEKLILMTQANKRQASFGYGVGSHGKVISCFLCTYNQTKPKHGQFIKFFINSITGGIS